MSVLFLNDSPVIRFGLAPAFRRLGRTVEFLPQLWVHESSQQVLRAKEWLRANEVPSIVFFEGFTGSRPIHPAAINVFRDAGARFGYWAIEDPLWTDEVISRDRGRGPYASAADHIFTPCEECAARYRHHLIPSSVLLFATAPDHHRPVEPRRSLDVVLLANFYSNRFSLLTELLIEPCLRLEVRLAIFGHGWDQTPECIRRCWHGPVAYGELPDVYAAAKVALGAEQCLNMSSTQCSMRVFEVLGCGGAVYLGPDHRAHRRLFESGKQLELTSSPAQTMDLLRRLLNDQPYRKAMAKAGRAVVLKSHTYEARALQILDALSHR
jgi:spore maturation protein CgeB